MTMEQTLARANPVRDYEVRLVVSQEWSDETLSMILSEPRPRIASRSASARRARMLVLAGLVLAMLAAAVGAAFVLAGSTEADEGLRARDVLSVLSTTPPTTVPADLTRARSLNIVDFTQTRELGRHLGRFDSSLFVAPGREGRSVCYMLHPSPGSRGIGTGYCHPLGEILQTANDHYSVMAPWSRVYGEYHTQVFGVIFDDVVEVRVRVDGTWRGVPILKGNGFYLDLPATTRVDRFEVTLADGTVQGHDFPNRP